MHDTSNTILSVNDLSVTFHTDFLSYEAVSQIQFSIAAGEIFSLVGESGCGKSLTAKAILGIQPENSSVSGKIYLQNTELLSSAESTLRSVRGQDIAMIFQEPMTALNPVLRVGEQCTEHLILHKKTSAKEAKARCLHLFAQVGIPSPEVRFDDYPHQMSGGMRQRVIIAMALACNPKLILADEPTTALDVTIQWQILQLLKDLAVQEKRAILLITHDLGVVAQTASRMGVMYAGQMVEYGSVTQIFANPLHPYTQGLLNAAPTKESMHESRLTTIEGSVPPPFNLPQGCRFHPRCPKAEDICRLQEPIFTEKKGREVRCFLA